VDNSPNDLAPEPENLVRLLELRNRYGVTTAEALLKRAEMPAERREEVGWYLNPAHPRARRRPA